MIVWLASYPRSGNTAVRTILHRAFGVQTYSLYDDKGDIGSRPNLLNVVGHLNHDRRPEDFYTSASKSDDTYFVKTHDLPKDDSKAIYVVRDGRSAIISYFHYLKDFWPETDLTLADLVIGRPPYGSWSEHFETWAPQQRHDTLLLRYNGLSRDPTDVISALAAFTGLPVIQSEVPSFTELHRTDPEFFRSGDDEKNIAELSGADLDLFWLMHGPLMLELGFVESSPSVSDIVGSCRHIRNTKQSAIDRLVGELEAVQADREAKQTVIDRVVGELAAVQADRQAKQADVDRLVGELEAVQADREAKQAVIDRVVRELAAMQADREAKQAIIDRLAGEVEAIKSRRSSTWWKA